MSENAARRAAGLKLMIFDVDGILTDGSLYISEHGETMKAFHVHDGQGMKMLRDSGIGVGLLSSRSSAIVSRRAAELGIDLVIQGAENKGGAFTRILEQRRLAAEAVGFMGDDLVDLPVLMRCGFAATVPEAPSAVRNRAHYVSGVAGGRGAARDVCDFVLRSQGRLEDAIAQYLP